MYTIGFANLSEESQFAVTVRESLERAVAERDNVALINRDNDLSDQKAYENARYFAEQGVDIAIFFHINERIGMELQSILRPIPVLTIDIPFPLSPHFGINNRQSGVILGNALADWINTNWDGQVEHILTLVDSRVIVLRDRAEYAASTVRDALQLGNDTILFIDCGNDKQTTIANAIPVFENWSTSNSIAAIGFNAESTFGLIEAAEQVGILDKLIIVGNAADHPLLEELQRPNTHVIAASYFNPANYGEELMKLVDHHRMGERLPHRTFVDMELHKAQQVFTP